MATNCFVVLVTGKSIEPQVTCYCDVVTATNAYKQAIRNLMIAGPFAGYYTGVCPKRGYTHKLTAAYYYLHDGLQKILEVRIVSSSLLKKGEDPAASTAATATGAVSATPAASASSTASACPVGPATPAVSAAPAASKVVPAPSGKTTISIPGVGSVEVDQAVLASALASALSSSGPTHASEEDEEDD